MKLKYNPFSVYKLCIIQFNSIQLQGPFYLGPRKHPNFARTLPEPYFSQDSYQCQNMYNTILILMVFYIF